MTAQKNIDLVKFKSTPTFLISGGAGTLACLLIRKLLDYFKDIKIIAIDSLESSSESRLQEFLNDKRFTFIKYDLNLGIPLEAQHSDCVLHLAAISPHLGSDEEVSLNSLLTSAFATRNLLDLAVRNNARFLLVSSINVYQGIISSLNLKNYFGPNQQTEKKFSHIEARRFAEALVWEYTQKYKLDSRIIRLGEMFGPGMDLRSNLGQLIDQTAKYGVISIEGDGLDKDYYIFTEDAAEAVVRSIVVKDTKDKIFPVCYEKSTSLIEASYIIKSISSLDVKITFKKNEKLVDIPEIKNIPRENLSLLGWKPKISLEEGLKKTLVAAGYLHIRDSNLVSLTQNLDCPVFNQPEVGLKVKNLSRKGASIHKKILFPIILLVAGFCFLNAFYISRIVLAQKLLNQSRMLFYQSPRVKSLPFLNWAQRILPPCHVGIDTVLAGKIDPKNFLNNCRILNYSANFEKNSYNVLGIFDQALAEGNFSDDLYNNFLAELRKAKEYAYMEISVKSTAVDVSTLQILEDLEIISPGLRDFLGFNGKKTYLVLIQDSSKLTVSGGQIVATANLSLDKGKIVDMEIASYDFSKITSAFNDFNGMAFLYSKDFSAASSQDISGVIGINPTFLKFLLKLSGPIYLPDPGVTVEEANFASVFAEHPYNVSAKILDQALQKMKGQELSLETIFNIEGYLMSKDVLVSHIDIKYKDIFDQLGWSGNFAPYPVDYLYTTDVNTGTTSVNNLITKDIKYSIEKGLDDKYISSLLLSYKHTGLSNSFPGGPYTGTYHIYIPYDASSIKAYAQSGSVEVDITKDVKITAYRNYTEISGFLALSAGKGQVLKFVYTPSGRVINAIESKKYNLILQKQPGAPSFSFTSPSGFISIIDRDVSITVDM